MSEYLHEILHTMNMVICVANNDFKVKLIIFINKHNEIFISLKYNLKYDSFPTRKPTFANMSEYLHENLHNMNMVICVANNDFKVKLIFLSINITKYSFRWNIILNMTAFRHENQLLQICLNICMKFCTIWTWSFAWQITTSRLN